MQHCLPVCELWIAPFERFSLVKCHVETLFRETYYPAC